MIFNKSTAPSVVLKYNLVLKLDKFVLKYFKPHSEIFLRKIRKNTRS